MRRLVIALMAALLVQFGIPQANACGDKTMRVRDGLRFYQPQIARHPSKILIHSAALPAGKGVELRDFLNEVGHKAKAMDDLGSIKNDLKRTHYDLVLTNLTQAPELQKQVESFTPTTTVVPVLLDQPKSEQKTAKQQYKVIVNNPKDGLDFIIAVSRVMNSSSKKS